MDDFFAKHGSDKAWHKYGRVYEPYLAPLRNLPIRLLEIGIAGGCSLRAWAEYFHHFERDIWGIDHSKGAITSIPIEERLQNRIYVYALDATYCADWDKLEKLSGGDLFDVVVDDGSHAVWATFQAFIHGWRLLKPGGLWFIEDTHASWDKAFRRDNEPNGIPETITILDCIYRECGRRLHEFGDSQTGRFTTVESDIESVTYFKSLIVVKKRLTKGAEE